MNTMALKRHENYEHRRRWSEKPQRRRLLEFLSNPKKFVCDHGGVTSDTHERNCGNCEGTECATGKCINWSCWTPEKKAQTDAI